MTQRENDTGFFFYDAIYDFPGFLHLLFGNWSELGGRSKQIMLKTSTCREKVRRTSFPALPHTFIL